uniref:hypothetical protein n=1 Tax=Mycoplasmopsis bovis TaxID=28903 RepID=UPI003D297DF4
IVVSSPTIKNLMPLTSKIYLSSIVLIKLSISTLFFGGKVINGIVEPKELKDIVFNDINSYYAKVNYAYLAKNNKAIYNGTLPKNNVEMESLIN